jgi:hypothetical protein
MSFLQWSLFPLGDLHSTHWYGAGWAPEPVSNYLEVALSVSFARIGNWGPISRPVSSEPVCASAELCPLPFRLLHQLNVQHSCIPSAKRPLETLRIGFLDVSQCTRSNQGNKCSFVMFGFTNPGSLQILHELISCDWTNSTRHTNISCCLPTKSIPAAVVTVQLVWGIKGCCILHIQQTIALEVSVTKWYKQSRLKHLTVSFRRPITVIYCS